MRQRFGIMVCVWLSAQCFAQASEILVPYQGVQDATPQVVRLEHFGSGQVWQRGDGVRARAVTAVAFDNLSPPCPAFEAPPNFSYNRADGSPLCDCPPDPADIGFTAVYGRSSDPCQDDSALTFPQFGVLDPVDLHWDYYSMDPNVGGDPNQLRAIRRIDFAFFNENRIDGQPPNASYSMGVLLAPFEDVDRNGNGLLDQTDHAVVATIGFDPNTPGGLFTASIDLQAAFGADAGLMAYGRGFFLVDFRNTFHLDSSGEVPACGLGTPFAGGDQPGCSSALARITVGDRSDRGLLAGWIFANDSQGADPNGPPWDPNLPIDPSVDGAPSSVSYVDVLNGGLLLNPRFPGRSTDQPWRLFVDDLRCAAGCKVPGGDADLDDDADVDLADLARVLANFGANAGHRDGDTNHDGVVDITDLGNVLAIFGAKCSCP